jgi:branched-chain amino acid transport system ATP-binding protein
MFVIETKNVVIKFGGLIAVNDVSIKIEDNKITALIGPNGAGKTTLFNCISGVYKINSGAILLDGKHIEGKRGFEINFAGIARTYQIINLFWKMTVFENVLVGMHSRLEANFWDSLFNTKKKRQEEKSIIEKAHELLQFVGLDEYAHIQAKNLSYGKQRLLEIVRGLASNPKVILLDEPAAGMNSAEKSELDALLRTILKMGVSILIVEHDMNLVVNVSDYIYVLEQGKLLAEGSPEEVTNNPDVIAAYLGGDDE